MKILLLLTSGLLFLSSSLCQKENKCNSSSLGCQDDIPHVIKTFRGTPQDQHDEEIPPFAIEGLTKTSHNKQNKLSSGKSNASSLKLNNTTMEYLTSSLSTKLIPAVYLAVVLVGVPSNALILWMLFFRMRSVRTAIFYTNLAISDFLFCITLPFKIAYHLSGNNWIFGEAMCRIMTVIFYGNMYCSILLLTCISISRYVAIVHPFTYRTLPKQHLTTFACGMIWTIVFLYMLPLSLTKQTYYLDQLNISTCHDVHSDCETASPFQFYYFISLAVFGFVIPLCIAIFCYFSIIRTLKVYKNKWLWYIKISLLILSIFAVCYTPSNIILIAHQVNYYHSAGDSLYFFYLIALSLSSLNSCLDPFLYFLTSKVKGKTSAYLTMAKIAQEECR
ncbi:PREDICTED: proteinase-activated receptor 3 [Gekko japonicus]|uniref:Proteinase-activated receptor 3 n=1 Tax=Gekko japonicus TaxID=146911 RepID=A0ABM1L782_GEKJA|nr:PREDICTED: proteinase-activated receptor 3 [Gekko japonicus]